MKIIHITDTHLLPPGGTIFGLDPAQRLGAVVEDVIERHRDADLAVITGDLADRGEIEAYRALAPIVARLPMPVRRLIGNNDSRENFRAAFPDHPADESGFVQSVLDAPGRAGRLIFLDTHVPGWSGGALCAEKDCRWAAGAPNYNIIVLDDDCLIIHAFDFIGTEVIGIGRFPPGP